MVRRQPAVIVAVGSDRSAAAAKAANATLPIVFVSGFDPVQLGFVASFSRPSGYMTGTYSVQSELIGKMLSLLHELVPKATTFALLQSSDIPQVAVQLMNARQAAATLGLHLLDFNADTNREIEAAFVRMVEQRVEALVVPTNPFFMPPRENLWALSPRLWFDFCICC